MSTLTRAKISEEELEGLLANGRIQVEWYLELMTKWGLQEDAIRTIKRGALDRALQATNLDVNAAKAQFKARCHPDMIIFTKLTSQQIHFLRIFFRKPP
jgi:hypothetical protein